MRTMLGIMLAVAAVASLSFAGNEAREVTTLTVGTNAAEISTGTFPRITGKINEVAIDITSGTSVTGDVYVSIQPELSTMARRLVYTNAAVAADVNLIPRFQACGTDGSAISGVYDKMALVNDDLIVRIANAGPTGGVIKVTVKYEKEK